VPDTTNVNGSRASYPIPYRVLGFLQFYQELGAGSFGTVVDVYSVLSGLEYAVKYEVEDEVEETRFVIPYECLVYKALGAQPWLPKILWNGRVNNSEVMVMEKVGVNLEQLRRFCRGNFTLKTVLSLADQLVSSFSFRSSLCKVFDFLASITDHYC